MSVLLATLSAFCNACTSVLQRSANVSAPPGSDSGWRLGLYLLRKPIWLAGAAFMAAGFAFAAAALYFGQLALVQPLLVSELIFTLILRRWWLHQRLGPRPWIAAALTCAGLAALLVIMSPGPGHEVATARHWAIVVVTRAVVVALLLALAQRGSPVRRAALYGAAAAIVWALDAAFTKATADVLANHGWLGVLTHWPVYPLILTGILGTVLTQAAFKAGPLSASQPALVIVDPFASIVLGVQLFGEQISSGGIELFAASMAFVVMAVGVILMSRWAPKPPRGTGGPPVPSRSPDVELGGQLR